MKPVCPCIAVLLCAAGASSQPLISLFDDSAEGWTVETRLAPNGSFNLIGTYSPDHVSSGGDTGGYISELDPDGHYSFFRAPASWSGDRSSFSGRVLRYSTRTDTLTFPDGRLVIMFGADGTRLSHNAGLPPLNTWTRRAVPLREGAWHVGTSATGAEATQAQIDGVLGSLEALFIGLEFGGDTAEELVDLDRVAFGVCAVDLAEPFGLLDLTDVVSFVSAFTSGDPAGDMTGDGLHDLSDLVAFADGFTAGCP